MRLRLLCNLLYSYESIFNLCKGGNVMGRYRKLACTLPLLIALSGMADAASLEELYTAKAIVTGTGEKNRQFGFRDCLERVLVRVSGDQRVLQRPEIAALQTRAGRFVQSFSYRDRLAGKPVHDEQGTYDRPHDLTCRYAPDTLDEILATLGSRPWRDRRPALAVFLRVERDGMSDNLDSENLLYQPMREAFANAGSLMAMTIVIPSPAAADAGAPEPSLRLAASITDSIPLSGTMIWSDPDLGWVATWHLRFKDTDYRWEVRGVNFDEAFRVAVRGAAQILSGNGQP